MAKFVGLIRNCEVCGAIYKSPQSQAHVRTCSAACGYKIRSHPNKKPKVEFCCPVCGGTFFEHESHASRRTWCSHECKHSDPAFKLQLSANNSKERNAAWRGGKTIFTVSSTGKRYGRLPPDAEAAKVAKRRAARINATPAWADGVKMLAIYAECRRISISTGVVHHVDHIVPLESDLVCGLHCEANLQILTGAENLKKHNKHWPGKA